MNSNSMLKEVLDEVSRIIIGKKEVLETILVVLLSEGHVLLEGTPGTGKTLMANCFARAIGGTFKRLQMTSDLLPADIVGTSIFDSKIGDFRIKKGPIFADVILADELNRATPKTQAALLEAMQEKQVTIEGTTLPLPRPFIIMATQVPYGGAGTYPLTDVQIDRFTLRINIDYPSFTEEVEIISRIDDLENPEIEAQATPQDISSQIERVKKVYVSSRVMKYIVSLVNSIRQEHSIRMGPSPRGAISLYKASRARALLKGRDYVIPDDVKALAPYVLNHRVILTPEGEAEELSADGLIAQALTSIPIPKE